MEAVPPTGDGKFRFHMNEAGAEEDQTDVEEAEDVDSEKTASGGYEAEEDVDSDDTVGGEHDDFNENTDGECEQGSSREASNEVEAEADSVGDHDIVDIPEEDMITEAPDMEMYLQESVEADESDSQGLEMVNEEPDNAVDVASRGTRSKLPKSIRDLLDHNNPGLLEDASQGRVESAHSPQTRAKVRRVSQRLHDLERKQANREETLNSKRSVVRKLDPDVLEVVCTEEDHWKSWLAR